jgi:hypothetical protein
MGKKNTNGSIPNMIDFLMVQVGLTREQATIAVNTIVQYMQKSPGEPLHRIVTAMFGNSNDDAGRTLN